MKAKELMIGDWYNLSTDNVSINRQVDSYFYQEMTTHSWMRPIELTPEILAKNDLPQYEWVKIYFQGEYGTITDFSKMLKYVHELQHALRLCGLNDLADNFRID